jgi:hypothetical protein
MHRVSHPAFQGAALANITNDLKHGRRIGKKIKELYAA